MKGQIESSEAFFARDEVVAEYATFDFLLEPERVLIDALGDLSATRMLDIGVGGGRTTCQLLGRVRDYVGLDLSPQMVEACRSRFADRLRPGVRFVVGDAIDLIAFADASFDLVLFAFNGIDSIVRHADRLRVLREVRRVCTPGATFAFSSDNLLFARRRLRYAPALWAALAGGDRPGRLARARRALIATRRLRRANAPLRALREPHARYVIERPVFELSLEHVARPEERIRIDGYCVEPAEQRRQLLAAGFDRVQLLGVDGSRVTDAPARRLVRFPWLYYTCRAAPSERAESRLKPTPTVSAAGHPNVAALLHRGKGSSATFVTLADAIPGARLEIVRDARHLIQLDAPEALATSLHRWLTQQP